MSASIISSVKHACSGIAFVLCSLLFLTGASKITTVQYVSPMPDSKMVSAQTNIILRVIGTLDRSLKNDSMLVYVYGSLSGRHPGHLAISDDNETIVFNPTTPFSPGELVSVRLRSEIRTQEGFTINPYIFSFRVSPLTSEDQQHLDELLRTKTQLGDIGSQQEMDIQPPLYKESTPTGSLPSGFPDIKVVTADNPSPGYVFLGSFKILRSGNHFQYVTFAQSDKQYVLILDNTGKPFYYKPTPGMNTDFKVQPNGHLTYYDDNVYAFRELDTNYNPINMYAASNGYKTDVHAFKILPNGHVIFLTQDIQTMDMSSIVTGGSPSATVIGIAIQELDKEKNVVFQWRSLDHFKITDATQEDLTEGIVDYVHPNAIEMDADGNILLSSRHLDEITKIDRSTGAIIWRWGGKNNQFRFINDTLGFSHQHSIRKTMTGSYILFDNGNFRDPEFSRVVEYTLDEKAKTATLIWQYRHTPDIFSTAMGSVQRLPNGNTIIGWGTASTAVTEVHPDGTTALELQLPDSVVSYRTSRSLWPLPAAVTSASKHRNGNITFSLHQNYPNPFNPSTTIKFDLPDRAFVSLKVYDLLGRVIATLLEEDKPAGNYSVPFNASPYSSGTYMAVLKVTSRDQNGEIVRIDSRKMVLNK
jgi:hypothetical protein